VLCYSKTFILSTNVLSYQQKDQKKGKTLA